ncbi:carbohydrate ABC transporter permease [Clostridium pasteurianum]|uniref:ABC-type sugar transport system, permease component n=1 Tax=Clostridium pasteurianum BC1 TaxID=86416 RepID=R4KFJ3_CLOPA|nr:carbohydrate ABC transporter permease [Clostridium pasteurianum]AGK98380.1 ABC-type sugar transport system, permease component [Clostridium pasteurianum BC1]
MFKKKIKYKNSMIPGIRVLNYTMLLILFITMAVPMINVLAISFSTKLGSMQPGIRLFPDRFTLEGYKDVWTRVQLWRPFFNSLFVTILSTFIEIILSSMAGYVLIQKDLPFKKLMTTLIIVTMMIPGDLTLISIYSVNKQLGLLNTYTGLIVNSLVSGLSILLMRNYFLSVPESLAEAARLDNTGEFKIFWRIYLPLSVPGLATVTFIEFINKWNSLMIPTTLITQQDKYTLPLVIRALVFNQASQSGTDFIAPNTIMAAMVISIIPLILIYIFAQRFLISGMTIGASKE